MEPFIKQYFATKKDKSILMHTKRRDSTGWPLGKAILESAHVCDYHVGATESAVGGSRTIYLKKAGMASEASNSV